MRSGHQEQMCVKLDLSVGLQLSNESMVSGKAKNRIINEGVLLYCNIARLYREYKKQTASAEEVCAWLYDSAFKVVDYKSRA